MRGPPRMKIVLVLAAGCFLWLTPTYGADLATVISQGNPVIDFNGYFHVDFPNVTLDQLYECLCHEQIIGCIISYRQSGDTPQTFFPVHYTVTNLHQTTAVSDVSGVYKPVFMCHLLLQARAHDIKCYRQAVSDQTCSESDDNEKCLFYSVKTNLPTRQCSYSCSYLVWIADFTHSLDFYNFRDLPKPIENGVCPAPVTTTSSTSPTTSSTLSNSVTASSDTTEVTTPTGIRQTSITATVGQPDTAINPEEDSKGFSLLVPIAAASGVFLLIITAGLAYIIRRFACRGEQRIKLPATSVSSVSESEMSVTISDSSVPENHTLSSTDEVDEDGYLTLEEMADSSWDDAPVVTDECDDKRYEKIKDCIKGNGSPEPCSRPLPAPPDPQGPVHKVLSSTLCSASVTTTSSSPPTPFSYSLASSLSPSPSYSLASSLPSASGPSAGEAEIPTSSPVISQEDEKVQPSDGGRPKPTPHQRHVDLDNCEYMGEVNLRRDHPALRSHMRAKLVRTPWGDMELISLPGELSVFTGYYSRLQLVSTGDTGGPLGVVGLSEEMVDNDSHTYIDLRQLNQSVDNPCGPENLTPLNKTESDQEVRAVYSGRDLYPHIFYFGALDLDEDAKISSCDYLTVLDFDLSVAAASTRDYLTVLDINPSAASNDSRH